MEAHGAAGLRGAAVGHGCVPPHNRQRALISHGDGARNGRARGHRLTWAKRERERESVEVEDVN